MSRDIDIDQQELAQFIDVLSDFQDRVGDQFKSVEAAWERCDESWQGMSKEQFTQDFEKTCQSITTALQAGDDALQWLENFDEILKEFERQFR